MNQVTYTIRINDLQEYVVRFRLNGVLKHDWTYFTNSREDAEATAQETIKHHAKYVSETGLLD